MSKISTYTDIEPICVANGMLHVNFTVKDNRKKLMVWDGMTVTVDIHNTGDTKNILTSLSEGEIQLSEGEMKWRKNMSALDPALSPGEYDIRFYITQNGEKLLRAKGTLIIEK